MNIRVTYNKYRKILILNVNGICVDDAFSGIVDARRAEI